MGARDTRTAAGGRDPEAFPTPPAAAPRRSWTILAIVLAAVVALLLVLWLAWGFRWPPTAEVVSGLAGPWVVISGPRARSRQEEPRS